ncbi:LuxR C-terminal-related transcriptional regulator [Streptomyces sp. MK7]|uniref:helix-turn-helix transcriptional regulator n=1 Tax=Streptomyces sp. MK7 TaxID=3067635 RepID=UPI00292FC578|nr:LuxR C-terminal-related transcriptional regulator [Streptomyces sp. MK7]
MSGSEKPHAVTQLHGREPELAALRRFLTGLPDGGGMLVVRGGAGIGKSSLLGAAAGEAAALDIETLSLTAVQAETRLPFATAHAMMDLLGATVPLPVAGSHEHNRFQLALALLEAVTARSARRPLLLLVDDAQWMDAPSWEALAFVGRRLSADPVALIMAMRDGTETEARLTSLPADELRVEALPDDASGMLLEERAPELTASLGARVLAEAAGNPLALTELAAVAARIGEKGLLPISLPLTARLERTFGAAVVGLPPATQTLLLMAALDEGNRLEEILSAAGIMMRTPVSVECLEPAITARLVDVDDAFLLRFRHPLIRSAIQQGATLSQRQQANAALAEAIADPDRAVHHRAAATVGTDEQVSAELDDLAGRLRRRGASGEAARTWEQAARLTGDRRRRANLLMRALEVALELADRDNVDRLLRSIVPDDLTPEDRVVRQWLTEVEFAIYSGAARLPGHLDAAERLRKSGQDERALEVVHRVAVRSYFACYDKELRGEIIGLLERLALSPLTPKLVATLGLAAPVERGTVVVERLNALLAQPGLSSSDLANLAAGATAVGALGSAARLGAAAVSQSRREGNLGTLTWALGYQAWNAVLLGDASLGRTSAAEADTLLAETRQGSLRIPNMLNHAHAEALRGDGKAVRDLLEQSERVLLMHGAHPMFCLVRVARGVCALAEGRYHEAHDELDALFDPSAVGYHPHVRLSVLAHLAEAGAHSDRHDQVAARIRELEPIGATGASPLLSVHLHCAKALLATGEDAVEVLGKALEAGLTEWPFERARLQLAHGTLLRRDRPSAARPVLRAAAATFDALGARPWVDRAHAELRASGETRRRRSSRIDQLTPQELQVTRLVAQGLSNREIAARLFLSPRTISTHLYRIYPKAGVSSRTELASVMARNL